MKTGLGVVFLVTFLDLLGFGIIIPILPFYAENYGASAWMIGWIMTGYSLMQFLFSPFWGRLSDRYGRRPVLLLSICGSIGSMLVLALSDSLTGILAGRLLAGIFGANISTAYAYVSDITTRENRAKGMGMLGAAFGLGFTLGPALGGLLAPIGHAAPFWFAALLSVLNLLFAAFRLPESRSASAIAAGQRRPIGIADRMLPLRMLWRNPKVGMPVLLFFLVTLAITQMEVILALYMNRKFAFDARSTGLLFALFGLVMVLVQGGAIGRLTRQFGEARIIMAATLGATLALAIFPFQQALGAATLTLCALAAFRGMLQPALSSVTSLAASEQDRGMAMGLFHSSSSFARVIGPLGAGWAFDAVSIEAPFLIGALFLALAFLLQGTLKPLAESRPK